MHQPTPCEFSPEIKDVRQAADSLIREHKLMRLYETSTENSRISITRNNLWRFHKYSSGEVVFEEFCLKDKVWRELPLDCIPWSDCGIYPKFPMISEAPNFRPIVRPSMSTYTEFKHAPTICVVQRALLSAGFAELPGANTAEPDYYGYSLYEEVSNSAPAMARKFLYRYMAVMASSLGALKGLRKYLWLNFFDRDLMSALLAMLPPTEIDMPRYFWGLRHKKHILRIFKECHNLLPLLPSIDSHYWEDSSLFSDKNWVRRPNPKRVGKARPIKVLYKESVFNKFARPSAMRWLRMAPISVVTSWAEHPIPGIIENLALANINFKVPAKVLCRIIGASATARRELHQESVYIQRFYRLYALRCYEIWKNEGWKQLTSWLKENESLCFTLDWLASDGLARRLPDKNSTWASITRQSEDWHIDNRNRGCENHNNYTWTSGLPEMEIDEIRIIPLTSSEALRAESATMHHCVHSYDQTCHQDGWRVFSLVEPDGARSTLCIYPVGSKKMSNWKVQQHSGPCNAPVSAEAKKAAPKIAKLYKEALLPSLIQNNE